MAEQPKTNLYTCWCGKPRNLELHFCKEHGFLEDKLKQARAEVLAACIKELERLSEEARGFGFDDDSLVISNAKDKLKELEPAASDLEAHDDYIRKLRDMDWIREFPVVNQHWCPGFPEGVKPYLEALLREARCDEIRQFLNKTPPLGAIRSVESLEDWIHKRMDYLTDREFELEKARASEGKG